jgi:hypothetical protein
VVAVGVVVNMPYLVALELVRKVMLVVRGGLILIMLDSEVEVAVLVRWVKVEAIHQPMVE